MSLKGKATGQAARFKLSVITVCLNAENFIEKTILSVLEQKSLGRDVEYIVVDGESQDETIEIIQKYIGAIDVFVAEKDGGIYDAMNKGIEFSTGDGLLFLNSGDYFVGDALSGVQSAPLFLPVNYVDFLGRYRRVSIKNKKEGLPNCHQGIVFPRSGIRYSLRYKICSDYDYFLKHEFRGAIPMVRTDGFVHFSAGVSVRNFEDRDREMFLIRVAHFGRFVGLIYEGRNFIKRVIRRLFRLVRKDLAVRRGAF